MAKVVSFNGDGPDELLRIAACMEEHFPHSMAKAVVGQPGKKVWIMRKCILGWSMWWHGISTHDQRQESRDWKLSFCILRDEGAALPEGYEGTVREPAGGVFPSVSGIEGQLAAVICIEDPLREGGGGSYQFLRRSGIKKIVMMTGDSERTASAIAKRVGVDEYYSEVLPEDKAGFVEREKAAGRKVIMVGDGINDSPALCGGCRHRDFGRCGDCA